MRQSIKGTLKDVFGQAEDQPTPESVAGVLGIDPGENTTGDESPPYVLE